MIEDAIDHVRAGWSTLSRPLRALTSWRRRLGSRRRVGDIDRLGDHLRKDIGFARCDLERQVTDWL